MSLIVADRVQETGTVSTGTGTVNLAGAVLGYQSFVSGIGSTNTTYYCIYDPAAYTWEVGVGQVTAGTPNTLARTTVYANSAGTQPSKISFSTTDTLTVFVTQPAETAIYTGASASLNSLSTTASTTGSTNMGPFNYGTLNYSDTGIVASYQTSVNSYFQMVLQNTNNGTAASTDYIVSSNNGTSTTNYGDFGINSSSFSSGTGALNQPSTVYLYSQSTDLAIGTNSSNALHFVVNGAVNATDAMTINAASSVAFNGQYGSTGQVLTSQGSSTPPTWTNPSNVYTRTQVTATAGQTTFTVSYTVGYIWVHRNGVFLGTADYTATSGTSVVLASGAVAGDLIDFIVFAPFSLASATGTGNVVLANSPTITNPILAGATSGGVTLAVPAVSGTNTATFPAATGTVMVSGNMPAFSAYQSSAQSLSSGTATKIQFQTKEFDTANCFDNTTNYRFTPNVAGYYQISGGVSTVSSGGTCQLLVYKNGSQFKVLQRIDPTAVASYGSCLVYMNGSTDYVELYYYLSGITQNTSNTQANTYFQASMVRSA